jgi:hypothetical protein
MSAKTVRNVLGQATTGVKVKRACPLARRLKLVLEASVRKTSQCLALDLAARAGLHSVEVSRVGVHRRVVFEPRSKHDQNGQGYSGPPTTLRVLLWNTGTPSRAPEVKQPASRQARQRLDRGAELP